MSIVPTKLEATRTCETERKLQFMQIRRTPAGCCHFGKGLLGWSLDEARESASEAKAGLQKWECGIYIICNSIVCPRSSLSPYTQCVFVRSNVVSPAHTLTHNYTQVIYILLFPLHTLQNNPQCRIYCICVWCIYPSHRHGAHLCFTRKHNGVMVSTQESGGNDDDVTSVGVYRGHLVFCWHRLNVSSALDFV